MIPNSHVTAIPCKTRRAGYYLVHKLELNYKIRIVPHLFFYVQIPLAVTKIYIPMVTYFPTSRKKINVHSR